MLKVPHEMAEPIRHNPRIATFALAWLSCKLTEPLRFFVTIAVTPTVANVLGRQPPKEDEETEPKSK
jgi:hypothetical protein